MFSNYFKMGLFLIVSVFILGCSTEADMPDGVMAEDGGMDQKDISLPDDAVYALDTERSSLEYGAYKITGSGHTGTVDISEGRLVVENGMFTSGNFVMDMTTITDSDGSSGFVNHVKSEDFFDVENYPTSELSIQQISLYLTRQMRLSFPLLSAWMAEA